MASEEIIKKANELGLVIDYIPEEWLLKEDRNVRFCYGFCFKKWYFKR